MKTKILSVLFCLLFLFAAEPVSAGWQQCWRYTENNTIVRSAWRQLDGSWYYFNADGIMHTGWVFSGGKWYYCGEDGKMDTGWLTLNDGVYLLDQSGAMISGCTVTLDGSSYRFDTSGRAVPLDENAFFSEPFSSLSFEQKLSLLRKVFPDGSYWNCTTAETRTLPVGVTDIPCAHHTEDGMFCRIYNGKTAEFLQVPECYQCLGFANLVSDFLFGKDSEVKAFLNYKNLRPGDHVRLTKDQHSFIVLEKTDDYVTVVECNGDYGTCRIRWDRKISAEQLKTKGEVFFLRRTAKQ